MNKQRLFKENVTKFAIVAVVSLVALVFFIWSFPAIEDCELSIPLPWQSDKVARLKTLAACAKKYRDQHLALSIFGFSAAYITLQTLAIPGPIFLSILAGSLFGIWWGQAIVAFCATSGACCCYWLSNTLGRGVVRRLFPSLMEKFSDRIQSNRDNLFWYLLFLRITPLLPNWFVNIASPLLNVPLTYFASATFLGLIPANFIHVSTGVTLSSLTEGGLSNLTHIFTLIGIGLLALVPALLKNALVKYGSRFGINAERQEQETPVQESSVRRRVTASACPKERAGPKEQ